MFQPIDTKSIVSVLNTEMCNINILIENTDNKLEKQYLIGKYDMCKQITTMLINFTVNQRPHVMMK